MHSQEHIVSFVDLIDDGGGPALVMKYLTLGNLSGLEKISLSIQVLSGHLRGLWYWNKVVSKI